MTDYRVAVVGAVGMVGQEIVRILQQRKFPVSALNLFGNNGAGKKLTIGNKQLEVRELNANSFREIDIAFFAAGMDIARHNVPNAVRAGAVVIDTSSEFRMSSGVPLVIPEVNPDDIKEHKGIISCPNCSTIPLVVALYPLHKANPVNRIIVDTYQAVSGVGAPGVYELTSQTKLVLEGRPVVPHFFPHQIAFNLLPQVDLFLENGYTREENKMIQEPGKIMHAPNISISATCVRVPIFVGNGEAVHIEFANPMTVEQVQRIFAVSPGIIMRDDPSVNLYPEPWAAAGTDAVFVGRLRKDTSSPNGIVMWLVADNIRKGAALNAVQIAEVMIKQNWVHPGR